MFGRNPNKKAVRAIESGDLDAVKGLIDEGLSVDVALPVKYSSTLLHYAVLHDQALIVSHLISRGANPGLKDSAGWTPLDEAFRKCSRAAAKVLVAANAPLSVKKISDLYSLVRDDCRAYVLDRAAEAVRSDKLAEAVGMLDAGLDVNAALPGLNGQRLLHLAAAKNKDLTNLLVHKGADVNVTDESGHTPLDMALIGSQKETAVLLKSKGAVTVVCGPGDMEAIERELNPVREDVTLIREIVGCHLTESFNFSTRMVACAVKSDGKVVQFNETPFDEFKNRPRLREAFEAYKKQGGTADDSILTPGYDSRRKEPLVRKPVAGP